MKVRDQAVCFFFSTHLICPYSATLTHGPGKPAPRETAPRDAAQAGQPTGGPALFQPIANHSPQSSGDPLCNGFKPAACLSQIKTSVKDHKTFTGERQDCSDTVPFPTPAALQTQPCLQAGKQGRVFQATCLLRGFNACARRHPLKNFCARQAGGCAVPDTGFSPRLPVSRPPQSGGW